MPTVLLAPHSPVARRPPPPAAARSTAQDISARAEVKSSCERSGRPWGTCLGERGVALARATKRGRGTRELCGAGGWGWRAAE